MAWVAEPGGLVGDLVEKYKLDGRECTALSLLLGELSSGGTSNTKNNLCWGASGVGHRAITFRLDISIFFLKALLLAFLCV